MRAHGPDRGIGARNPAGDLARDGRHGYACGVRDHYEVLQVDPRADPEVIRAAYRVLARKYHPDHGGDPQRMIALNDAWDVLGSPERRVAYDATRAPRPSARPSPAPATASAGAAAPESRPTAQGSRAPGWDSGSTTSRPPASTWASNDNGTPRAGPPPGNPSGSVLDFGQYSGWSLGEIARFDINYLEWLERSPSGRRLRDEIDVILRQRRPAPGPQAHGRFGR
jgi:curved DNA-binding protein CbpA